MAITTLVRGAGASAQRPLRDADRDRRCGPDASDTRNCRPTRIASSPGWRVRSRPQSGRQALAILTPARTLSTRRMHGRRAELDTVHLPLRREPAVASVAEAGDQAGNSHVGSELLTRRRTLYAAGGNDDAVHVYTRAATISLRGAIALDTTRQALPAARGQRSGDQRAAQRQRSGRLRLRTHPVAPTTTTIQSASSTPDAHRPGTSTIMRPYFANNETTAGVSQAGTFPFGVRSRGRDGLRVRIAIASSSSSTCLADGGRLIKRISSMAKRSG